MTNIDKYKNSFLESLSIEKDVLNDDLKYNDIPEWDSIGHMTLMSSLEDVFQITLETDDIVDFSSYKKGLEILKKYNLSF
jgi:acyl carrier protein